MKGKYVTTLVQLAAGAINKLAITPMVTETKAHLGGHEMIWSKTNVTAAEQLIGDAMPDELKVA